ncbi:MAG TPA: NAD(P)/FAD-dependent oxidoreductase [Nannocystis sp.]
MARTPLLRSLVNMARKQREQPVAVERPGSGAAWTRRRFGRVIAGTAAGTGALLAGCTSEAGASQPRIVIVGAGIAGLSAALELADAGIEATVYEAAGRVGGRMFSNTTYFDQGQVFEWCGELIDSGHLTILALAQRFGLTLDDLLGSEPEGSEETYYFQGNYYSRADAERDFLALRPALEQDLGLAGYPTTWDTSTEHGRMLDDMSVYDWIALRVPGGHASPLGMLLNMAYYIELNADTREQSALNIVYLLGFQPDWADLALYGFSDEQFHIRGGNQQIPVAIAESLGSDRVRLGRRMESIVRRPQGDYELLFRRASGDETVIADIVLLTLPFAVLRDLDYSEAGFDDRKHRAIQELGRGRQSKQHLQFDRRVWNEKGPRPEPGTGGSYSDTGYQATWETSRGQPGAAGILVGYCGGACADAMTTEVAFATATVASVRTDATDFLARAEPVFPGLTAAWNGRSTQGIPHLDPNFGCSYSYWRIGQYQSIAGYEGVRQGNVFFAGEHTSIDFQGFMEGGAAEGVRAAQEILAAIAGE